MSRAKKLPSGNWRVNQFIGRDNTGKRLYKSFTAKSKKEAELMAKQYVSLYSASTENITVAEAIDRYIDSKDKVLSPTTISVYRRMKRTYFQNLMNVQVEALTMEQIQRAVNAEAVSHSAKTVSNAHGLLAAALRMHRPNFLLHTTLPRRVKKLKRDLPTSKEVLEAVRGSTVELPVLLAMCMCLRMSEVRGIRKDSLDGDYLFIDRVVVDINGKAVEKELAKTDATRRIEKVPEFLRDMILELDTQYVTYMTGNAIYKVFKKIMINEGYPAMRFHDLRHIAASDMHRLGLTDRVAAERGGWSGTETMKRIYQHSFSADRQAADDTMNEYYQKMHDESNEEKSGQG